MWKVILQKADQHRSLGRALISNKLSVPAFCFLDIHHNGIGHFLSPWVCAEPLLPQCLAHHHELCKLREQRIPPHPGADSGMDLWHWDKLNNQATCSTPSTFPILSNFSKMTAIFELPSLSCYFPLLRDNSIKISCTFHNLVLLF